MKCVYLDTNALLTLADGSHLLEAVRQELPAHTVVILNGVLQELEKLSIGSSVDARKAKLAYSIVKKQHLKTAEHSQPYVDTALVSVADNTDAIVTLDKELQKRARTAGIPVFTIARTRLVRVA